MRKFLLAAAALVFVLCTSQVYAFPAHTGLVTDAAGMLSVDERSQLETRLRDLERSTSVEFAIVVVPNIAGYGSIEEYANKLFHEWGIGKSKTDNGLLFVWDTGDRKLRFEVGYGLEGLLPDARVGRIIRDDIAPLFKEARYSAGLNAGIDAVTRAITATPEAATTPVSVEDNAEPLLAFFLMFILIAGVGVVAFFLLTDRQVTQAGGGHGLVNGDARLKDQPIYTRPIRKTTRRSNESNVTYIPVSISYDSVSHASSIWSSSDSSSSSSSSDFSFGGGDSGGAGASGDY